MSESAVIQNLVLATVGGSTDSTVSLIAATRTPSSPIPPLLWSKGISEQGPGGDVDGPSVPPAVVQATAMSAISTAGIPTRIIRTGVSSGSGSPKSIARRGAAELGVLALSSCEC